MDLHSLTIRLEEMRIKRRESEQWMHHMLLPQDLRQRVRRHISTKGLIGLTHLDLFCAKITDNGSSYLRNLKNFRSLKICGRRLTDVGVKNIKDLQPLVLFNLSQNSHSQLAFYEEAYLIVTLGFDGWPERRGNEVDPGSGQNVSIFQQPALGSASFIFFFK
ncbi:F-box/LRR-repeat protein 14-like protein isoform X2 [Tanacetum coccineum]